MKMTGKNSKMIDFRGWVRRASGPGAPRGRLIYGGRLIGFGVRGPASGGGALRLADWRPWVFRLYPLFHQEAS